MSISPTVELLFHPTDLDPRDLSRAGQFLGSPSQAIEAGLGALRLMMVDRMKQELAASTGEMSVSKLVELADLAWSAAFWKFRKISAPVMADAYVRAYRQADAGDVPMALIYDLADKHADRIGDYFHQSSKQAMVEGFNSYVNRRVASKAAANRVLDAYGLTPRQMGGYVSASASMDSKVSSRERRSLKGKVLDYVARSFRKRIKIFADQEEHNIDQQAQQFAWMWLVDKGRLNADAEKIWITAHDEKVCPVCGPLHGQKVGVNEQFESDQGAFWTPGIHPNCRCHVRLIEHTFRVSKAYVHGQWQEREHPRGSDGEFAAKPKKKVSTLQRTSTEDAVWLQQMRARAQADVTEAEQQTKPVMPMLNTPMLGGAPQLAAPMLDVAPQVAPVAAPVEAKPMLDAPVLMARPQLDVAPQLVGHVELGGPQLNVDTLLEANPQLTVAALQQSSVAYDQALQQVTETTPDINLRNVYDIPGDRSTGENLLYYYDPYAQVYAAGNDVQFTTEHQWLKGNEGRIQIFAQIQKDTAKDIEDTLHQVMTNDLEQVKDVYVDDAGHQHATIVTKEGWAFSISEEDLHRIITDVAYKQTPEPLQNVTLWDPEDPSETPEGFYKQFPASQVTEALNLKPELFEKTVFVTQHGHDEQAIQSEAGTKYGMEIWLNTGEFQITDASDGARNEGVARLTNVEPDVEIKKLPND